MEGQRGLHAWGWTWRCLSAGWQAVERGLGAVMGRRAGHGPAHPVDQHGRVLHPLEGLAAALPRGAGRLRLGGQLYLLRSLPQVGSQAASLRDRLGAPSGRARLPVVFRLQAVQCADMSLRALAAIRGLSSMAMTSARWLANLKMVASARPGSTCEFKQVLPLAAGPFYTL